MRTHQPAASPLYPKIRFAFTDHPIEHGRPSHHPLVVWLSELAGKSVFDKACALCHANERTGTRVPIVEMGIDRERLDTWSKDAAINVRKFGVKSCFVHSVEWAARLMTRLRFPCPSSHLTAHSDGWYWLGVPLRMLPNVIP